MTITTTMANGISNGRGELGGGMQRMGNGDLGEERGAPIREGARRGNQSGQGMSRRNQRGWAGRLQAAALGACQGSRVGAWEQGEDSCGRVSGGPHVGGLQNHQKTSIAAASARW